MSTRTTIKTTFKATRTIEPIYTGGEVSSNLDGSLLATSVDDDILLTDLKRGRPVLRLDGDGESITSLALSPHASHLVVCSRSLSMRIFTLFQDGDSFKAELVRTLKPHTSPVVSSTIDRTGTILVTGGADGTAKVWDINGGYCSHTFHGHGGLVTAVELFESTTSGLQRQPSGKKRKARNDGDLDMADTSYGPTLLLATGSEDGKIKLWDLSTRKTIATLDSHVSVVRSLKYSPDHQVLLSASRDKTIVIWDSQTWQPRRIIPVLEVLESAGFVPGSDLCYGGGENGRLRIWSAQTGKEMTKVQPPGLETETIVKIVSVAAEDALMTVHQDQTMCMQSCAPLRRIGQIDSLELPILRRISGNHDEIIDMACVGPRRSHLALATNTETVKIISVDEETKGSQSKFGSDVALLEGHQDIVICMDVDWSGCWLATGAKDNTARLWRIGADDSSYECFATFSGHAESLGAIALPRAAPTNASAAKDPFNHPPSFLITGSQDKTIKRWDTSKLGISTDITTHHIAKAMYTRVAHDKDINAIDVSPTAPFFASASQDRTIKIWSIEDGSTAGILRGHKRGVWSVQFSPPGIAPISLAEGATSSSRGFLVSGSGDRTVKIWSLSSYTCILTFEGHSNSILKVIWLPPPGTDPDSESNNRLSNTRQPIIASASSDTLIKLWTPYASPDSDHLLATLDNHSDRVWSLASPISAVLPSTASTKAHPSFSLISGAADATLTFWADTTSETAHATSEAFTKRIEEDQLLQNHIHARNYRESILLSLKLNHPARLLKILSDVVLLPDSEREAGSLTGVQAVDDVLSSLSQEEVYLLLCRIRDWNVNARTAPVAQRVLNVLLKKHKASTWSDMARNRNLGRTLNENGERALGQGKAMNMQDLFRALEVYTERHYKRMEELVDESYLIEYTLREMDEVAGTFAINDTNAGGLDISVSDRSAKNLLQGHKSNGANSILS